MADYKTVMEINIRKTIQQLRQDKITGMSLRNLFQIVPSDGICGISVSAYTVDFFVIARLVCEDLDFAVISDDRENLEKTGP